MVFCALPIACRLCHSWKWTANLQDLFSQAKTWMYISKCHIHTCLVTASLCHRQRCWSSAETLRASDAGRGKCSVTETGVKPWEHNNPLTETRSLGRMFLSLYWALRGNEACLSRGVGTPIHRQSSLESHKNPAQNKAKPHVRLVTAISFTYLTFLFPTMFLNVERFNFLMWLFRFMMTSRASALWGASSQGFLL